MRSDGVSCGGVKQSVQVEIAGQTLSIRTDEGPEYVRALADYVDAHLRELAAGKKATFNLSRMALLVAIQIADELFREKDRNRRLRCAVDEHLATVRERLREHRAHIESLVVPSTHEEST